VANIKEVTKAEFNPLVKPYLLLYVGVCLILTILFVPLALVWFCGVGQWWARHYYEKLECKLNDSALSFRKGILFQVEKTIPLENIQDITFIEGPLLKHFDLSILKFETAGRGDNQANNMRLVGIIKADEFRNQIVARREKLRRDLQYPHAVPEKFDRTSLLKEIVTKLDEVIKLLREGKRAE